MLQKHSVVRFACQSKVNRIRHYENVNPALILLPSRIRPQAARGHHPLNSSQKAIPHTCYLPKKLTWLSIQRNNRRNVIARGEDRVQSGPLWFAPSTPPRYTSP